MNPKRRQTVDLVIETEEAGRLARELADVTGEKVDVAVTKALAERLVREKRIRAESERLEAALAEMRGKYDTRPVTKQEWDWASGDED